MEISLSLALIFGAGTFQDLKKKKIFFKASSGSSPFWVRVGVGLRDEGHGAAVRESSWLLARQEEAHDVQRTARSPAAYVAKGLGALLRVCWTSHQTKDSTMHKRATGGGTSSISPADTHLS